MDDIDSLDEQTQEALKSAAHTYALDGVDPATAAVEFTEAYELKFMQREVYNYFREEMN